jgi:hypothetical protein
VNDVKIYKPGDPDFDKIAAQCSKPSNCKKPRIINITADIAYSERYRRNGSPNKI